MAANTAKVDLLPATPALGLENRWAPLLLPGPPACRWPPQSLEHQHSIPRLNLQCQLIHYSLRKFLDPAWTLSLVRDSIILVPRSYMVSISVVLRVSLPTLEP